MNRFIFLLCCLLPSTGLIAQLEANKDLDFFFDLAIRDAKFESSLTSIDTKDEEDFWIDQLVFEKQLSLKSKEAYRSYISGKNFAYQLHLHDCADGCKHSELYFRQASYYVSQATLASEASGHFVEELCKEIRD